jgi:hypothetical protein
MFCLNWVNSSWCQNFEVLRGVTQMLAVSYLLTLARPKTDVCCSGWRLEQMVKLIPFSHKTDSGSDSVEDHCHCRTRQCNNPPPLFGGTPCAGIAVAVTKLYSAWGLDHLVQLVCLFPELWLSCENSATDMRQSCPSTWWESVCWTGPQ